MVLQLGRRCFVMVASALCGVWRRCSSKVAIRSFHTVLTGIIFLSLLVKETALRDEFASGNVVYCGAFLTLLGVSMTMYHVACYVDPGYVPFDKKAIWQNDSDEEMGETGNGGIHRQRDEDGEMEGGRPREEEGEMEERIAETEEMLGAANSTRLRKCGYCGIHQPMRAKHCEDCGRCVRKFDHHCPWLDTCVGEQNHKFFLVFLVTETALILWAVYIVGHAITWEHTKWPQWFSTNLVFLCDILILAFGGFAVVCLTCFHSYLMATNQTTWECVSRDRISYLKKVEYDVNPFHEGYVRNVLAFLCSFTHRKWDVIYRKTFSRRNSHVV